METSKESKLPEGIGRKIVDALKKQSESIEESYESNIFEEQNENVFTGYEKQDLSEKFDNSYVSEDYSGADVEEDEDFIYANHSEESEFESYEPYQEAVDNDFEAVSEDFSESVEEIKEIVYEQPKEVFSAKEQKPFNFKNDLQPSAKVKQQPITSDISFPANVEVLRKLISELPAGVTRQTGAQIIRQTMEAMGISMNSVLTEAQSVQENLGDSTKDCMNTIEEYRNNIKILEKKAQNYKRQADQLADLINLFIVTER